MDRNQQQNKNKNAKKREPNERRTMNEKLKYQQRVRFYVFLSLRRVRYGVVWKIVCGFVFFFFFLLLCWAELRLQYHIGFGLSFEK